MNIRQIWLNLEIGCWQPCLSLCSVVWCVKTTVFHAEDSSKTSFSLDSWVLACAVFPLCAMWQMSVVTTGTELYVDFWMSFLSFEEEVEKEKHKNIQQKYWTLDYISTSLLKFSMLKFRFPSSQDCLTLILVHDFRLALERLEVQIPWFSSILIKANQWTRHKILPSLDDAVCNAYE